MGIVLKWGWRAALLMIGCVSLFLLSLKCNNDSMLMSADVNLHPLIKQRASGLESGIPLVIHQTWKDEKLPSDCINSVSSWKTVNNRTVKHMFYTDADIQKYIDTRHPELISAWKRMKPIHKADFFRYIILNDVGGYYADIDVSCRQPIHLWTKIYGIFEANVGFISGFEMVSSDDGWKGSFARQFQMCQWTMASRKNHGVLKRVIAKIKHTFETAPDEYLLTTNPVRLTGPAVWGDSVEEEMDEVYGVRFGLDLTSPSSLKNEHILVGDMLLLPVRAFGVGSAGYMFPSNRDVKQQLVYHGFHGSWKGKHVQDKSSYVKNNKEGANVDGTICEDVTFQREVSKACFRSDQESPSGHGLAHLFDGRRDTSWSTFFPKKEKNEQNGRPHVQLTLSRKSGTISITSYSLKETSVASKLTWRVVCFTHDLKEQEEIDMVADSKYHAKRSFKKAFSCEALVFNFQGEQEGDKLEISELDIG
eukprot:m.85180 g.85180  ORF g.85180 m.85180 type:complete len:477 (-) comp8732_c0_seq2:321-1751(-)